MLYGRRSIYVYGHVYMVWSDEFRSHIIYICIYIFIYIYIFLLKYDIYGTDCCLVTESGTIYIIHCKTLCSFTDRGICGENCFNWRPWTHNISCRNQWNPVYVCIIILLYRSHPLQHVRQDNILMIRLYMYVTYSVIRHIHVNNLYCVILTRTMDK